MATMSGKWRIGVTCLVGFAVGLALGLFVIFRSFSFGDLRLLFAGAILALIFQLIGFLVTERQARVHVTGRTLGYSVLVLISCALGVLVARVNSYRQPLINMYGGSVLEHRADTSTWYKDIFECQHAWYAMGWSSWDVDGDQQADDFLDAVVWYRDDTGKWVEPPYDLESRRGTQNTASGMIASRAFLGGLCDPSNGDVYGFGWDTATSPDRDLDGSIWKRDKRHGSFAKLDVTEALGGPGLQSIKAMWLSDEGSEYHALVVRQTGAGSNVILSCGDSNDLTSWSLRDSDGLPSELTDLSAVGRDPSTGQTVAVVESRGEDGEDVVELYWSSDCTSWRQVAVEDELPLHAIVSIDRVADSWLFSGFRRDGPWKPILLECRCGGSDLGRTSELSIGETDEVDSGLFAIASGDKEVLAVGFNYAAVPERSDLVYTDAQGNAVVESSTEDAVFEVDLQTVRGLDLPYLPPFRLSDPAVTWVRTDSE
jgi:hypothetical protein